jgi:hypothetical protein
MNCIKKLILLACVCFLLTTCGIDEYYYLPQVPVTNIPSGDIYRAYVIIPPLSSDLNYAAGYNIYYRIYTSNHSTTSIEENDLTRINSSLNSDYFAFKSIADPTTTMLPNANTFSSRKYFVLEFDKISSTLPVAGGVLQIIFPTNPGLFPAASFTPYGGGVIENILPLRTSTILIDPNRMFGNTAELRSTTSEVNLDVSPGASDSYLTYVAMYIVAYGTNRSTFTTIFSKPTFVGVFPFP